MSSSTPDLRHLPLFRPLSDAQLDELLRAFKKRTIKKGETLFREGQTPTVFQILTSGEIEIAEAREPKVTVRPVAPIGELGALTGLPRNTTAVALTDAVLLEASSEDLMRLFAKSSELALTFYRSLLEVVGDKVRRDKARMDDMRANIIKTQKSMKELRELLLSSAETPLSQPVCDKLDELIENNRRAHYRVSPVESHPASARLEGGSKADVVELSQGFVKISPQPMSSSDSRGKPREFKLGSELTLVLALPSREIPISGRVERAGADGLLIKLDLLIDEYQDALCGYMTELQMLDIVV